MRCRRCQGLMVSERFVDLAQTNLLWTFAWRCVNCGEVLDAEILSHRWHAGTLREPAHKRAQNHSHEAQAPTGEGHVFYAARY